MTSFCSGIFSAFLMDEILSAFFSIILKVSIKLIPKFSFSFDIGIAADVGCLLK